MSVEDLLFYMINNAMSAYNKISNLSQFQTDLKQPNKSFLKTFKTLANDYNHYREFSVWR
jgi:hypothetical protein